MSENNIGVLEFFPSRIAKKLVNYLDNVEEIRIRQNKKIVLKLYNQNIYLDYVVSSLDVLEILQKISEFSIYSYQNQISQGYITVSGGHRVGITGSCVLEKDKVININYISSMNFRIARQVEDAAVEVIKEIRNENYIYNTIIISPPGYGKTTILKDVIKKLSSGMNAVNVGVVDERGEIASLYRGQVQNDLGDFVDVIENVPKSIGIKMLIRTMAPKVIVADEIGSKDDVESINYAFCSGVSGIFTAHGDSYEDFLSNPIMRSLLDLNIIDKLIFLSKEKGKIKNVIDFKER